MALVQLMRSYNRSLYRAVRSILKSDAGAEKALQETYVHAWRHIGQLHDASPLAAWLTRVAIAKATARARRTGSGAAIIPMNGLPFTGAAEESDMNESASGHPDKATVQADARRLLEAKIDELPDAYRTVFVLRELEEMTVAEVAACLDIPEAKVRTRLFRAKCLLREALAREIDEAFAAAFAFDGARSDRTISGVSERLLRHNPEGMVDAGSRDLHRTPSSTTPFQNSEHLNQFQSTNQTNE